MNYTSRYQTSLSNPPIYKAFIKKGFNELSLFFEKLLSLPMK